MGIVKSIKINKGQPIKKNRNYGDEKKKTRRGQYNAYINRWRNTIT